VSFRPDEIAEMKAAFAGLLAASEGGTDFILIRSLKLPAGCDPSVADALLCPSVRDGYPSRLYLSTRISHKGLAQNWNADQIILGRLWFAVSWRVDQSASRLLAILAAHLEAFTCKSR
jgi:hypothetical protein